MSIQLSEFIIAIRAYSVERYLTDVIAIQSPRIRLHYVHGYEDGRPSWVMPPTRQQGGSTTIEVMEGFPDAESHVIHKREVVGGC